MSDDMSHADPVLFAYTGSGWTVEDVGGWAQVPAQASALIDTPDLIALTNTITEDGPPTEMAAEVLTAVVQALSRCSSPAVFGECLTVLLDDGTALATVGEHLYDVCLEQARFPEPDADQRTWLLAADALEGATRLALGDWVPRYDILGRLTRLPAVCPPSFARPALRCVAAAYERWRDSELLRAVERLAGLVPDTSSSGVDLARAKEWAREVEADAAFELGCASLLQALDADTVREAEERLQAAERQLTMASTSGRVDADALTDVVRLFAAHLPTEAGRVLLDSTELTALAQRLERNVREHVLGYTGLAHWRSPRLDIEIAWAQLAHDVARAQTALKEPSWYHAETVISDVLAAYSASRCSRVLHLKDQEGVQAILGPAIESGIAVQTGLMKHLDDHIHALEAHQDDQSDIRGKGDDQTADESRETELVAARALLAAARDQYATSEPRPKAQSGADGSISPDGPATLPLLHAMLSGDTDQLAAVPPDVARSIEAALVASRLTTGVGLSSGDTLVIDETLARLQRDLAGSPDYRGEVKLAVDEVQTLLLRFWHSRDGLGATKLPYLFKPDAIEEALADDLKLWFDGTPHATRTATEVRNVGGGRVDVACVFPRFRLYIELKKDDRNIDIAEKRRYLAQTAGYQSADVTIGFLAILDLRKRTGPTPHLRSCFKVVVLDDPDLGRARYIVTMVVPGNRTEPSAMR